VELKAKRKFKNELYDRLALVGNALASGRRLELLDLLAQGERSVETLAAETDQPFANVSQHLQVLRRAQLVEARRQGTYAIYRLSDDSVLELWLSLRKTGEKQVSEIGELLRSFFRGRSELQAISQEELNKRLDDPGLAVLDVRPAPEYEAGHIAGARSIPISELRARLRELRRSRKIVAYCRGPHCVFADEAVEFLKSRRYRAFRLESGFPEWKLRGYPITAGPSPNAAAALRGN
jgi:rhodanese-related sulfurtransferase/DNA-binding transcriptional ArsR family regulator